MAQTTQQIIDFINSTSQTNSITGKILAEALNGLIAKSSYAGVAKLSTDPGTPEGSVFYIATEAGTFTHFNNAVVKAGEFAVFVYKNGSWLKESVDVASNLGSPDDNADAAGSAFARINKVVDDIRKINEKLEAISLSASNVYYLQLINALTTESDADAVKYAFTPLGAEEPVAPEIGDILYGKLNAVERENRYVFIEYVAVNTVGAQIRTLKYTIDGVTYTLMFNVNTWSIVSKEDERQKLQIDWYFDKNYLDPERAKLFIKSNIPIPNGAKIYLLWRSRNKVKRMKEGAKEFYVKGNRWTFPSFVKFNLRNSDTDLQSSYVEPFSCTLERYDVILKQYIYSTEKRAIDIAEPFVCFLPAIVENGAFAVKINGGGRNNKVIISRVSQVGTLKFARLRLGIAVRTGKTGQGVQLSNMAKINVIFDNNTEQGLDKIGTSMNDLLNVVFFERP